MKSQTRAMRSLFAVFALFFAVVTVLSCGALRAEGSSGLNLPEGAENVRTRELYKGVTLTSFDMPENSALGLNKVSVVEFDPSQSDLYIDVTNMDQYSNKLKTVSKTVEDFNAGNNSGKTAIAAVNGDLWMVAYAHARVEGSGTQYGGYSDPVVTKSLTIPRGFNMYNGEIISSAHISQETPYEGAFQSFGFTADNKPYLGQPTVNVKGVNTTQTPDDSFRIDGINRLPADNAVIMYTDKGVLSHYALSDAYEVVIDCDTDYVVKHGAEIKGKVTAICKEGDEDPSMKENRIILTARGKKAIARLEDIKIGDEIDISVTVRDAYGNNEVWQNDIYNAVGGHMVFARDGQNIPIGDATRYPTTILAETNDGKVLFIQNDGRQSGYSLGIKFSDYGILTKTFNIKNAFILDGGGSSSLVALAEDGYELVNRPSDKNENGEYGAPRTVVNSVILSYGTDRNAPQPTEEPVETESPTPANNTPAAQPSDSSNNLALILVIGGSVLCFIIAVIAAIIAGNRKYGKKNK